MAGTGWPPKKNAARDYYGVLPSQADPTKFQASPTLASGDFKQSGDGGTLTNLGTLPTVTPAAGQQVLYPLSATELNVDRCAVLSHDVAGAEWFDTYFVVETSTVQLQDLPLASDYSTARAAKLDNLSGDAYVRLGAPAGASVSADISAVKAETDTILTDVNTGGGAIYNRLGAPAGASIAADLAAVKTDTGHIGNPAGASLAADVAAVKVDTGKIGNPAGVSVSADIAAAKVDTAAIKTKTDSLAFTKAGQVDANTLSINGATILGGGTLGNEFHP